MLYGLLKSSIVMTLLCSPYSSLTKSSKISSLVFYYSSLFLTASAEQQYKQHRTLATRKSVIQQTVRIVKKYQNWNSYDLQSCQWQPPYMKIVLRDITIFSEPKRHAHPTKKYTVLGICLSMYWFSLHLRRYLKQIMNQVMM